MGFHAAVTVLALAMLPVGYGLLAAGLAARAVALPVVQRARASGTRQLRPIHVGLVEIAASLAVVWVSFALPL